MIEMCSLILSDLLIMFFTNIEIVDLLKHFNSLCSLRHAIQYQIPAMGSRSSVTTKFLNENA
jgi:hypothetical protein